MALALSIIAYVLLGIVWAMVLFYRADKAGDPIRGIFTFCLVVLFWPAFIAASALLWRIDLAERRIEAAAARRRGQEIP